MSIGIDTRISEKLYNLVRHKFDTKRWDPESFELCFFKYCFDKFDKSRLFIVIRACCSPSTKIDPGKNYFFATTFDKGMNLRYDLFHRSPLVSSTCLNRQAECTKIVTSCLDDHILSREEFFPCDFSEGSYFCPHHFFFFFSRYLEIIRIFGKYFYMVFIVSKFAIYLEKSRIHNSISDISTSWEKKFFSIFYFWEDFFCMFDPFCFCFIRHHAGCYKISTLVRQVRMDKPFFREIFIGFTTENFIIQNTYLLLSG